MKQEIIKTWFNQEDDTPQARAELIRFVVKEMYNFVKFDKPGGEGLDGRDGKERQSLAKVVDAAENHYSDMLELKNK